MTPAPACWALLAGLALAACSGASRGAAGTAPEPAQPSPAGIPAIVEARADSARQRYTEADVRFMSAMIGHHAQAIEMAGWAPAHGANPAVRRLAERIISGQEDEIATMQQWLRDRGLPVPSSSPGHATSTGRGHGGHPATPMPGMLTETEMRQLDQARGAEFDRRFLESMIRHHRGAVAMVKELFGSHGAAQDDTVFKFASDVNVDQTTEIARMESMLAALPQEGG